MGRVAKVITVSLNYKTFVEVERKKKLFSFPFDEPTFFFHANTFLVSIYMSCLSFSSLKFISRSSLFYSVSSPSFLNNNIENGRRERE